MSIKATLVSFSPQSCMHERRSKRAKRSFSYLISSFRSTGSSSWGRVQGKASKGSTISYVAILFFCLWGYPWSNESGCDIKVLLKVSKFQKQIILSTHSPKNQRNFSHFSALASKKSWKIVQTQDESTKILIWCYLTQWNSFIALIRPLLKARAKNVKNCVGFLGYEMTRLFTFEIYWPLGGLFSNLILLNYIESRTK